MKLALSKIASVLPEHEGAEALNYLLFEGLPNLGSFPKGDDLEQTLLNQLKLQLNVSVQDLNIVLGTDLDVSEYFANAVKVESFAEALRLAQEKLAGGAQRVNLYSIELEPAKPINETTQLAFSERFDATQSNLGSEFAVAVSLEQPGTCTNYLSIVESISELDGQAASQDYLELGAIQNQGQLLKQFALSPNSIEELELALGSVTSCFGYGNQHVELLSLLKLSLQCHHRYIAGTPAWSKKSESYPWAESTFYVPERSRFWFVKDENSIRSGLLALGSGQYLQVSDEGLDKDRDSLYFSYASPHFFPLSGNDLPDFLSQFNKLREELSGLAGQVDVRKLAASYYQSFIDQEDSLDLRAYRAVILAEDKETLLNELDTMEKGIERCFELKQDLKTPKGSYLTLEPLGEEGKLAFVFPGLGSSYLGLGQKIFQLFPSIYKESFRFTKNVGEELQEKVLYPRTQDALTFKEKRQKDMEIVLNLKDLGKTDTTYSSICAHVMTDVFKVNPDMAFGYSMGEANMMTALDVWNTPAELENRFKASDIFKDKLYGNLTTVRKFWGLSDDLGAEALWTTFTLKASAEEVKAAIKDESLDKVYLTLINTEDNVVIAGEPQSCLQLITKLNTRAIPMGFVPAIHCEPTAQEYEGIAELYSMPTADSCSTKLYSSSCYLPVPVRQKAIAYAIAKCFSEPVDFPRLVNKVYDDGARIFLEAGAGRICSTWIDKILQGKKHVIVPLNAKGTEDSLTFARVMAKLFCHKVDVNLHPLYEHVSN